MEGFFTKDERCSLPSLCRALAREVGMARRAGDFGAICKAYAAASPGKLPVRDRFGFNPVLAAIATATALCRSVEADRNMVLAVLLSPLSRLKRDSVCRCRLYVGR